MSSLVHHSALLFLLQSVISSFVVFLLHQDKLEKKSSEVRTPDGIDDNNGSSRGSSISSSDQAIDEEAPLIPSRLSHIGRSISSRDV